MAPAEKQRACDFPSSEERECFTIFRNQTVAEDNLINHRMCWLIYLQAALLVFLGGTLLPAGPLPAVSRKVFFYLIGAMGILHSILVLIGIWAAIAAIDELKVKYKELCACNKATFTHTSMMPDLTGGNMPHFFGKFPLVTPIFFLILWVCIISLLRPA
jgi:hypothetical protein